MILSDLAVRRPVLITMFVGVLVVMGAFSYGRIPLDLLPKVDIPIVTVVTVYPGAGPREVETLITKRIEEACSSINGIDFMKSESLEGVSNVMIRFVVGVDVDFAAIDVREKISTIQAQLPKEAEAPVILKLDINAQPIVDLAVSGQRSAGELTTYVEDYLKDPLSQVSGVAQVEVLGGRLREIHVLVDEKRAAAFGLGPVAIAGALAQRSLDIPGGHVIEGRAETTVRLSGEFGSVEEIEGLQIPTPAGKVIHLREIATVADAFEEQREAVQVDGKQAVALSVKKRSDANTVRAVAGIMKKVEELRRKLPADMEISVITDRSVFIQASVDDLWANMAIGIALTAVALFVFLHSFEGTIIAALSMPASIVATFLAIYFLGFTLNMMSLMALAIVVGILVNNAIVVLENIYDRIGRGQSAVAAAREGTGEIALAVTGATMTNVVVFLPIAFMGSIVGMFFKEFGVTATYATLMSLIVAFTLTPMLAAWLSGKARKIDRGAVEKKGFAAWWDRRFDALRDDYGQTVRWALHHPFLVLAASVAAFVASLFLVPHIGIEFFTEPDQGEFAIVVRMPAGTSLDGTLAVLRRIEERVNACPERKLTYVKAGKVQSSVAGATKGVHLGEVSVLLVPKAQRTRSDLEVMDSLRAALSDISGAVLTLARRGAMGPNEAPLQVEIMGPDFAQLQKLAGRIRGLVESTEGSTDIDTSWEAGKPELELRPDRIRCEQHGVTVAQVAQELRARFHGLTPLTFRDGDTEYDIRIKLREQDRKHLDQVADLRIATAAGLVPLKNLCQIQMREGPARISRMHRERCIILSGHTSGRSFGKVLEDVRGKVEGVELPQGYWVDWGGNARMMGESFGELIRAFVMAMLLTYMLLAALMESFIHPITILSTMPLAIIGVIVAMFLTGATVSIFSLMALVMLVGIVVNNGILLTDYTEQLRREGMALEESLARACPGRFRPIAMTAVTAVLAMLPLALGTGEGGEMRAPMAIVSIGGLVMSTLMSLYVIPALYLVVERLRCRVLGIEADGLNESTERTS